MIRTAIIGAAGRMGKILVSMIAARDDLALSGAIEYDGCPVVGQDAGVVAGIGPLGVTIGTNIRTVLDTTDAVIDFSTPESTMAVIPDIVAAGAAAVIGTTGLSAAQTSVLHDLAAGGGRLVVAPNMSVGVNLLFALCAKVAPLLGDDYDIEVVEMHHNRKKDAPSGTAVRLGEILASTTGRDYAQDTVHGRVGQVGARTRREIGMHALRGGDVVGDHTVIFAADGERVELTHRASSRETFAKGALRAVSFLANAQPGIYDMQDVLGLR
mgnify:CR=1 FL=1